MTNRTKQLGPTFWLSIVLIALGIILLLENLDIYYFDNLWEYWPVIFIIIGLIKLVSSGFRELYSSLVLIAIGGFLLLIKLDYFDFSDIWQFWPVILIIMGGRIIYNKLRTGPEGKFPAGAITDDRIDHVAIFGGKEKQVVSQNFQGGSIAAVFGGIDLYLGNSRLAEGENVLDVLVIFGGTDIYVPGNWKIITKGLPVFGGFEDKRSLVEEPGDGAKNVLIIKGLVLFGGLEIKDAAQKKTTHRGGGIMCC